MSAEPLLAQMIAALGLPAAARCDRRIPKALLAERGASSAPDRKLIDRAVERLDWLATLSPATVGVAAFADDVRPVAEIQLVVLHAREEPTRRLPMMIHRAIPYPLLLLSQLPGGGVRMSLAPLRRAERIEDAMVVERLVLAPDCTSPLDAPAESFVAGLPLAGLPLTSLSQLYEAWLRRAEALSAARISGAPFRLLAGDADNEARRAKLAHHAQLEADWIAARAAARKEKRLGAQVQLAERARSLKKQMDVVAAALA
jgi:hypothetical protein